jgi:hypothetical protein
MRWEAAMECLDRETATAYLRGDLELDEAGACAAHMAACEGCRGAVEEISALMDYARDALRHVDRPFDRTQWTRIESKVIRDTPWRSSPRVSAIARRAGIVPLIGTVVLAAAASTYVYEQSRSAPVAFPPLTAVPSRPVPVAAPAPAVEALASGPPATRSAMDETAALDLEVQALALLDRAGAFLGEDVAVRRMPGGIRIEASVDTDRRRLEIAHALEPMVGAAGVDIRLQTFRARASRRGASPSGTPRIHEIEVQRDEFPLAAAVRGLLQTTQTTGAGLDEAVRRFAGRAAEQSQQELQHAWAISRIVTRYSTETIARLPDNARGRWRALVRAHALDVAARSRSLADQLRPLAAEDSSGAHDLAGVDTPPIGDSDLAPAVQRLVALSQAQDDAVRAAFLTTSVVRDGAAVRSAEFWDRLREVFELARRIAS